MQAIIRIDVPEWQIGKNVSICFPDTMHKTAVVEKEDDYVSSYICEKLFARTNAVSIE